MEENQHMNGPSNQNRNNFEKNRSIVDNQRYKEETSAEIIDPVKEENNRDEIEVNNIYGWIAIALSVISFFFIPLLFAIAGIILGVMARNREAPVLGNTAITIAVISILFRLFILPLI